MEVEKLEDGPLKSNEIARFLEASKTAYKATESILTGRKETSFQQRTLLDIASETELRNRKEQKALKEQTAVEEQKAQEDEIKRLEEEEKARALQAEKDAENFRIQEEQKLDEQRIAKEQKEKEIYDRGFADGKVASESEMKEKMENSILLLENARKSIMDLNASHFIKLREGISSEILRLASARAGIEISKLPDLFLQKIESLIEKIGQITEAPTIYMNSEDLQAVKELVPESLKNLSFKFESREGLLNGDVIIEMGSVTAEETTAVISDLKEGEVSQEIQAPTEEGPKLEQVQTQTSDEQKTKQNQNVTEEVTTSGEADSLETEVTVSVSGGDSEAKNDPTSKTIEDTTEGNLQK